MNKHLQIRQRNNDELKNRFTKVREESEKINELIIEKEKLISNGKNIFNSERAFNDYQKSLRKIDIQIQDELEKMGFARNFLQPIYNCEECRDTGFVLKENVRHKCKCNNSETDSMITMADINANGFNNKKDAVHDKSQKENMCNIYDNCTKYCDEFPETPKKDLLFFGGTGLGKSYLAQAMANSIKKKGFHTCVLNSYKLMEEFRNKHINGSPYKYPLYSCAFLVIDDLGTEPMYNNITIEYLFALINERMENGKPTLVITNLSFDQCKQRYGERIASRVFDANNTQRFKFFGDDLRI